MTDKPVIEWDGQPVPMEQWGKDHWSTFAYVECRTVDHSGRLASQHLRQDGDRYPSRLKSFNLKGHDDLDCLNDAVAASTRRMSVMLEAWGFNREVSNWVMALTPEGRRVAAQLRAHKADGGNFASFVPPVPAALGGGSS
jgi:hypothetical protein